MDSTSTAMPMTHNSIEHKPLLPAHKLSTAYRNKNHDHKLTQTKQQQDRNGGGPCSTAQEGWRPGSGCGWLLHLPTSCGAQPRLHPRLHSLLLVPHQEHQQICLLPAQKHATTPAFTHTLTHSVTETLIHTFIFCSHLDYCNGVLSGLPTKQTPIFPELRYQLSNPHKLHPYTQSSSLRASDKDLLAITCTRLRTMGDRAFSVNAPALWNSLPLHIRSAPSLPMF